MDVIRPNELAVSAAALPSHAVTQPTDEPVRDAVRALVREGRYDDAWQMIRPRLMTDESPAVWNLGRRVVDAGAAAAWAPPVQRQVRLGVLCSYEAGEFVEHLGLACAVFGIGVDLYAAPFGQLEQEALARDSGLTRFGPTHVLVAPTTADLAFVPLTDDPERALDDELRRWRTLWDGLAGSGARVVQHAFVVPDESPLGHLALRVPGSRISLVRELNARLGAAAASTVLLVDVERIAAGIGKRRWFDPRLWYAARQPYSYEALPALARATAAVIAGDVGLAPRCLVIDLDNTIWGGVVGDDGTAALAVGHGQEGEAFAAFQEYLLALRERGMLLAVASKNDAATAREPFEQRGEMRLRLDDFDAFVADWRPKSEQIAEIADRLGLGLDSLVFVDDNPAECAQVAQALPSVETVALTVPASEFVRTLDRALHAEAPSLTTEDRGRAASYAALRKAAELRTTASTLPEFWRSLEMRARVRFPDETSIDRAAQLTQKTNQFNLTLVRRTRDQLERVLATDRTIARTLELEDRFAQHGIIGLAIAVPDADDSRVARVDTLLLSCRVIGRTAEAHLLSHLGRAAADAGYERLRGTYVEGPRNALVADLYPRLGFVANGGGGWDYDLAGGPLSSEYIEDLP
jgi:FkbH-like protein